VAHLAEGVDQTPDGLGFVWVADVERRRKGEEQGIVQGAGKSAADERGHAT
jgi:hypothetical protein